MQIKNNKQICSGASYSCAQTKLSQTVKHRVEIKPDDGAGLYSRIFFTIASLALAASVASNGAFAQGRLDGGGRADMPVPPNTLVGSATRIDTSGHLITAALLVTSCKRLLVQDADAGQVAAQLVVADAKTGLALIMAPRLKADSMVWLSEASTHLDSVEVIKRSLPGLPTPIEHSSTFVINSPKSGNPPGSVVWAVGKDLDGSYAGAPVFEPTRGRVIGIVEVVYSQATSASKFGLDKPVLLAAGAPIENLFLKDIAMVYQTQSVYPGSRLSQRDVENAVETVMCVRY